MIYIHFSVLWLERESLDAASSIAASSQEITAQHSQQIFKRAKLERQPLDATSSIAASSQEIAEQRSQQRFKKLGKPGFRIPKPMPEGGLSKRPKHPNCMNDEMCKVTEVRFNTLNVKK